MSRTEAGDRQVAAVFMHLCERTFRVQQLEALIDQKRVQANTLIVHPNSDRPDSYYTYPLLYFACQSGCHWVV